MLMRRMPLILAVVAVLAYVATAHAAVVIKTSDGSGADCELRESSQSTTYDPIADADVVIPDAGNRGANTELATREKNGARSSVGYMKFDITGLPATNDAFWSGIGNATLQVNVRNDNLPESRLRALRPGATSASTNPNDWNYTAGAASDQAAQMQFAVYALDPYGTYANDSAASATRTDRSGNDYTATQSKYEWNEGDNSDGSGIAFYDAPGVTPHCMVSGACDTLEYGGTVDDTLQSKGHIDDFNSNVQLVGTYNWPEVYPQNHLAVGSPINFTSAAVLDAVKAAKDAGRDSVTLIIAANMDEYLDNIDIGTDPGGLPTSFFNFNYLMVPKEESPLSKVDSGYDSDINDPNNPLGTPYGRYNADGRYAPKLILTIPEPGTLVLIGLGLAGLAMIRRRK